MSLFENNLTKFRPLADRMRPSGFDDFVGQKHLLSPNSINRPKRATLHSHYFFTLHLGLFSVSAPTSVYLKRGF